MNSCIALRCTTLYSVSLHASCIATRATSCILAVLQDIYQYCAYALVLQLGVFVLCLLRAHRHAQTAGMVLQRLVEVVIAAAPPQMPAVIDFALMRCAVVLKKRNIHIHVSNAIMTSADVEVAVFDKTGTLTGSIVRSRLPLFLFFLLQCMLAVLHMTCHALIAW